MAQGGRATWTRDRIDALIATSDHAGLLRDRGQAIYEIHPALSGFLRSASRASDATVRDPWCRAFATVMGLLANNLMARPLHEQRGPFTVHSANFEHARGEAERAGMAEIADALVGSLAAYAQNTWDFRLAEKLLLQLAESATAREVEAHRRRHLRPAGQLGPGPGRPRRRRAVVPQGPGDQGAAGRRARAARAYHQLGILAQDRGDLDAAERWVPRHWRSSSGW